MKFLDLFLACSCAYLLVAGGIFFFVLSSWIKGSNGMEQSINVHRKMNLGRGWNTKDHAPRFEGIYSQIKNRPGSWYVCFKGDWYATDPGPYGEKIDDLQIKDTVTINIVW